MSTFQTPIDRLLSSLGHALVTVSGRPHAGRPCPQPSEALEPLEALERDPAASEPLSEADKKLAGALMRVNHSGEVCAQALYQGQALASGNESLRRALSRAADEEADHLDWSHARITELGGSVSLLNPVWYAGSLAIGMLAGRLGDEWNLGFLAETENQVEAHLQGHLDRLGPQDL